MKTLNEQQDNGGIKLIAILALFVCIFICFFSVFGVAEFWLDRPLISIGFLSIFLLFGYWGRKIVKFIKDNQ